MIFKKITALSDHYKHPFGRGPSFKPESLRAYLEAGYHPSIQSFKPLTPAFIDKIRLGIYKYYPCPKELKTATEMSFPNFYQANLASNNQRQRLMHDACDQLKTFVDQHQAYEVVYLINENMLGVKATRQIEAHEIIGVLFGELYDDTICGENYFFNFKFSEDNLAKQFPKASINPLLVDRTYIDLGLSLMNSAITDDAVNAFYYNYLFAKKDHKKYVISFVIATKLIQKGDSILHSYACHKAYCESHGFVPKILNDASISIGEAFDHQKKCSPLSSDNFLVGKQTKKNQPSSNLGEGFERHFKKAVFKKAVSQSKERAMKPKPKTSPLNKASTARFNEWQLLFGSLVAIVILLWGAINENSNND